MTALHKPDTIYSLRHVPTWLLLALSAGAVNCGAFLACERFVTHVTGTVARLGVEAGHGLDEDAWWLLLDYGSAIGGFVLGSMASVLALDGRSLRGKPPIFYAPLPVVSLCLVLVAIFGNMGFFGGFGTPIETFADIGLIMLLSFAMGLQNASVATSTGNAVRTTHLTGPTTDFGVYLGNSIFMHGNERRVALRGAALRGGTIGGFISGAILMVPVAKAYGYLSFLGPAAICLVATALSFVPRWADLEPPPPVVGSPSVRPRH